MLAAVVPVDGVTPEKAHVESGQKRWQETVFGTGYTPTVDNGHVHGHAAALNGNVPAVRALDDVRDWTMGYASWEDGWVTADGDDDLMLLVEMSRDCGWLDTLLAGGTDEDTVSGDDRPDQWTGGYRLKQRAVSHLVVSASKD